MTAQNGAVQLLLRLPEGQVSTNGIRRGNHVGLDVGNLHNQSQVCFSTSGASTAQNREQARVCRFGPASGRKGNRNAICSRFFNYYHVGRIHACIWAFPSQLLISFMGRHRCPQVISSQPSGEVGGGLGILGSAKWLGSHGSEFTAWQLFARYSPSPGFREVLPSEKQPPRP